MQFVGLRELSTPDCILYLVELLSCTSCDPARPSTAAFNALRPRGTLLFGHNRKHRALVDSFDDAVAEIQHTYIMTAVARTQDWPY